METPLRKKRVLSDEHKAKIAASLKGRVPANKGRPMSEAQRQQISRTLRGRAPANIGQIAGWNKGRGRWFVCIGCGDRFQARPELRQARTKYCTRDCWLEHHHFLDADLARRRGAEHWNWKGGISAPNLQIRNSPKMAAWRQAVFERDDFTCRECGARGVALHAHHIELFSRAPDRRFDVDNGLTLCHPCHRTPGRHTWAKPKNVEER